VQWIHSHILALNRRAHARVPHPIPGPQPEHLRHFLVVNPIIIIAGAATTTGDTKLRGRAELRAVHVSEEAPKQPRLAILLLMKVAAFA
jgi:hypothetical protein